MKSKIVKRNYFKLGIILFTFAVMLLLSWIVKVVFKKQNNKKIIIHKVIKDKFEDNCDILNNIKNSLITDSTNFTSSEHLVDNKYNNNTIKWETKTVYYNHIDDPDLYYSPHVPPHKSPWCSCKENYNKFCNESECKKLPTAKYYNRKISYYIHDKVFVPGTKSIYIPEIKNGDSISRYTNHQLYFDEFIFHKDSNNNKYIILRLNRPADLYVSQYWDKPESGVMEIMQYNPLLGRNQKNGNIHKLGYKLMDINQPLTFGSFWYDYKIRIINSTNNYKIIEKINTKEFSFKGHNINYNTLDFIYNSRNINGISVKTSRNTKSTRKNNPISNNYSNILLKPLDFDLIENIPNTEIFKIIKEALIPKISIPINLEQIICNNDYNFSTNDKDIFLKYNNGKFKFIKLNLTKIDDNQINLIYKNWFYNGKGSININAGNVSLDTIKSSIENYINDNNISTLLNGSSSSSTTTNDISTEEVEIQEIINDNESIKLFSNILTLNNKIIVNDNSNKELIIDDKNIEIIGSSLLNFNMKFNFDVKFDMKYIIDSINETYQLNLNTNLLLKYKLVVKEDDGNQIYETEIEEKQINKLDSTINNIEINLSEELKQYLFLFRDAKYELQIEINDNDNLIGKTIYITPTAINFKTYFEDKLPKYSSDKAFDELQVSKIV